MKCPLPGGGIENCIENLFLSFHVWGIVGKTVDSGNGNEADGPPNQSDEIRAVLKGRNPMFSILPPPREKWQSKVPTYKWQFGILTLFVWIISWGGEYPPFIIVHPPLFTFFGTARKANLFDDASVHF